MEQTTPTTPETPRKEIISSIKDSATILGGFAGLFAVIFWVSGRMYAAGFLSAMNIPSYHVKFSSWEYSEQGWIYIFGITFLTLIAGGIYIFLLEIILDLLESGLRRLSKRFSKFFKKNRNKKTRSERWELPAFNISQLPLKIAGWGLNGALLFAGVMFILSLVYGIGQYFGRQVILNEGYQVDIVTSELLDIAPDAPIFKNSGQQEITGYRYEGFKLLTYSEGKYYLFKDLDPNTCRPTKVYILEESILTQVNLSTSPSGVYSCTP